MEMEMLKKRIAGLDDVQKANEIAKAEYSYLKEKK